MNLRRIPVLLSFLVCMCAAAAETTTPPSAPVSDPTPAVDPAPKSDASKPAPDASKPAPDASKPAPPKPVADSKGAKNPDGDFKPSEEISEDMAVAYPVDI
jgi:hypothetical protein